MGVVERLRLGQHWGLVVAVSFDDFLDLTQTVALLGVMVVLSYLVYLLRLELGNATAALHAIVRSQDEIKARLDVLERERGR